MSPTIKRRLVLTAGGTVLVNAYLPSVRAQTEPNSPASASNTGLSAEVALNDEPDRGYYANYDVNNFGPPQARDAKRSFMFPKDVESRGALAYGIDVSHHCSEVPWPILKAHGVNYVYIKASQSRNAHDPRFEEFWAAAPTSGIPWGAYHFLTAGVSGKDQGEYFVKRLGQVGGLTKNLLQPVIDLEWDIYGPDFKRVVISTKPSGPVYKDYWETVSSQSIVDTVNSCVDLIRAAYPTLDIRPIIYTNASWWGDRIPVGTTFPHCTVWISDYRKASYAKKSPNSVSGHAYYLWQFTDGAMIDTGSKQFGPFDANKLVFGGINHILIGEVTGSSQAIPPATHDSQT